MVRPHPQTSKPGGFTLIELMVLITIIGILTALILPEMKGTYQDALLRATARKLVNVFHLAASQAITTNQKYLVRFQPKTGHYVIQRTARDAEGDSELVAMRDIPGGEGDLDSRITVEVHHEIEEAVEPEDSAGESEPPGPGSEDGLVFYGDGTADAAELVLRDQLGFRLALRINPTTARVRVIELGRK